MRRFTPWWRSGWATLSRADIFGSKFPSWKMNETVFCLNLTSSLPVKRVMLLPESETKPELGFINPPRHLRSVDFPEPDGPTTATASPFCTVQCRPLRATTLPSSAFDS